MPWFSALIGSGGVAAAGAAHLTWNVGFDGQFQPNLSAAWLTLIVISLILLVVSALVERLPAFVRTMSRTSAITLSVFVAVIGAALAVGVLALPFTAIGLAVLTAVAVILIRPGRSDARLPDATHAS